MTAAIELSHVSCAYDAMPVLHDVSLRIERGQFAGIVGPSGSGKTTLLRLLLNAVPRVEGTVRVLGHIVNGRAPQGVGYVPQIATIDWNFPVTVQEVVLMGRVRHSGIWPWPSKADRQAAQAILERLGIADCARRHIRDLSGGQQQRVFLARALISNPQILLLDEPTANVDIKTRDDILHLLAELNREGITVVITTHELNAVAAHLPWVVCINRTVIAQGSPEEVFTTEVLSRTYEADLHVVRHEGLLLVSDAPHRFRTLTVAGAALDEAT